MDDTTVSEKEAFASKELGYTGLANLGNTCFLNSCVQVLNHTFEFDELFRKFDEHKKLKLLPDSNIIREFRELRTLMFSNNGIVSPNKFVHNVHVLARQKNRDIFTGWAQNDMPEFLLFMIECMHNCISRGVKVEITGNKENAVDDLAIQCYRMIQSVYSKEYSEIMDLFYGVHVSEIWDIHKTKRHSVKPESYFILDLPIPLSTMRRDQPVSLYDCFDTFTQSELLTGENAWWNEHTRQKEEISKNITFWNFPKVLVVSLKRFSPDGTEKNMELVDFPIDTLDLSKYVSGYKPQTYVYELYGVCNHIGNVHGGHYTAFVKRNGQWIHCNDTTVSVLNGTQKVVTPMAYCLFYRKKNTVV
jgi:ubiquitin carboxyl-terminal hydrolase 8